MDTGQATAIGRVTVTGAQRFTAHQAQDTTAMQAITAAQVTAAVADFTVML
jgi:hypothetical protein